MFALPGDVICGSVFPLLSVRDLQSLDTAYTNKDLRPHLRRLWKLYNYDNIDEELNKEKAAWCVRSGINIVSVALGEVHDSTVLSKHLRRIIISDCSDSFLMDLSQMCPQLEEFQRVGGWGFEFADDSFIALAQNCQHLHTVAWRNDLVTNASIQALCDNCPYLRNIDCPHLTDVSLVSIASSYPHLQSITIGQYRVTDAGLLAIADKCHELKSATVNQCRNVTSKGLAALWRANPNLIDVNISRNQFISDDDLMFLLECCPLLQNLKLVSCENITDSAVIALAERCPQLTSLNMDKCCSIYDVSLIALGQHCHRLKSLDISHIKNISIVGISALAAGCPLLQEFSAWGTNITDDCVIALMRGCRDMRSAIWFMTRNIYFNIWNGYRPWFENLRTPSLTAVLQRDEQEGYSNEFN